MPGPIRRAALGTLLAALLVVALEGTVRALGLAPPATVGEPPGQRWYRWSETLGWAPRPGFHGTVYGAERTFGDDGLFAEDEPQAAKLAQ